MMRHCRADIKEVNQLKQHLLIENELNQVKKLLVSLGMK
jgi:hypothetical protein